MAGLPGWVREAADRVVASDPGLNRLRMGASGAVAMASALAVEYGFATLTGANTQATIIAMLLGTIVAMMGSMALNGTQAWPKVRTAVFFPVAIGVGLLAGTETASNTDLMLGVFVVVMFLAVFVRRFGMAFFFYGFMGWLGYFFASFLHAKLSMFPSLIAAVGVGTAWVLLLSLTVLRTNAHRTLRRTRHAFAARARAVLRACAVLLEESYEPGAGKRSARRKRRLHARLTRLAESALMIEGWLGDGSALPEGWSGTALRRRLLDMQLAVDALAASSEALADAVRVGEADQELAKAAVVTIRRLARREDETAGRSSLRLADAAAAASDAGQAGWWPARHLADAVIELLGIARSWGTPTGADTEENEDESFEPAVTLMMGNLPSSAASARDVSARGTSWNPLARLSMTTRQALQVALAGGLAILVGRLLSEQRYYWAVIAAFVMFTGTATRSEAVIKGLNRVVGTLVGLFAGVALAHVTAGHTFAMLAVIVLSMSLGFYLVRISYAFMIFFVTIMVSQLYSALHEFSDGLLVLRLEETAIGAAIGVVVALVFVPLSTRDTVSSARAAMLTALADLLNAVADKIDGRVPTDEEGEEQAPSDLDGLARTLDDRLRQLMLVAKPLTRPLPLRNNPRLANHRLARYNACATQARRIVAGMRRHDGPPPATLAEAARGLADAATSLSEVTPGHGDQDAGATLENVDTVLFTYAPRAGMTVRHPVTRPLIHVQQLLREMAAPLGSVDPGRNPDSEPARERGAETGVVGGLVSTPEGGPVEEGVLLLTGPDGKQCARARFRQGRYRIDACPAGDLLAIVTAPGYEPAAERMPVRAGQETHADFTVAPAAPAEPGLTRSATGDGPPALVTGTVRGPADVGPLPDVSVTVFDESGDLRAGAITGEDGGYRLPELPAGRYTVVAAGYPPVVAAARLCPGRTCLRDVTLHRPPAGHPGPDVPRPPARDRGTDRSSRAAR